MSKINGWPYFPSKPCNQPDSPKMAEDRWAEARVAGLGEHHSRGKASVLMTRGLPPLPSPARPGCATHTAPSLPRPVPRRRQRHGAMLRVPFLRTWPGAGPGPPPSAHTSTSPLSLLPPVHPRARVAIKQASQCVRNLCKRKNEKLGSKNKTKTTVRSAEAERVGHGAL